MNVRWWVAACLALGFGSVVCAAEAPAVERLNPAGGARGSTVEVRFLGKIGDGDIRVLGEPTLGWTLNEKRDAFSVVIAPEARSGWHWVRFANSAGVTEPLPFFVGLIPEQVETEPNAALAQANPVSGMAVTVNGVLSESRDVDTFAVDLNQGQTLVAALQAQEVLGSPMDGVLQVVSPAGIVVAQNDDDLGIDPRLVFVAPHTGRWSVRTFAFPSEPNSNIGFASGGNYLYRLTLSTGPVVDHVLPMQRGAGVQELALFGWNLTGTTVSLNPEQLSLETGSLPINVRPTAVPVTTEDHLAERRLTLPLQVGGHLLAREPDTYVFMGTASQQVSLQVHAQRWGSRLDPVLTLSGPDGKLLKEHDDISRENPDSELHVTLPAEGEYKVSISDRFQHFGERYFYGLEIAPTQPTVELGVAKTALTMTAGQPLEIPVTIERKHGFSEVLQFAVEGLPGEITAELPKSEKEGDSSKAITIKLTGQPPAGFQGTIRIVAQSESSQMFTAGKSLPEETRIEDLWLTVSAPAG